MSHIFKIKRDLVSSRVKEARQASHYLYLSCHILSSARENVFNSMLEMVRLKRLPKLVCFFFWKFIRLFVFRGIHKNICRRKVYRISIVS